MCAGGNINRIEDVKKLLYVRMFYRSSSMPQRIQSLELANVASEKFGKDKILLSISNVRLYFQASGGDRGYLS